MSRSRVYLLVLLHVLMFGLIAAPMASAKKEVATWPEITPAERELKAIPQDPDAAAVILLNRRDGKVTTHGKYLVNALTYHWRLKVLNERGRKYSEVEIPANKYSKVSNIEARTVKSDGAAIPVAPDQIFEKTVAKGRGFKETAWVFSFPAVEPGTILEYRYEREANSLIYVEPWFFSGPEFTVLSHVSQAAPSEANYITLCDKCPNPEPDRSEWREGKMRGRIYTLEMRDVPADRDELWMPPDREAKPRFEMILKAWDNQYWEALGRYNVLFSDWASVARYVDFGYRRAYLVDESEVAALTTSWTQGAADPAQKVHSIAAHVQADFRYIGGDVILPGTRSITDIIKAHSADNEEKAVLLAAALRSLGLKPSIALVAGRHKGPLYANFYSLTQFSHAVVALPKADGGYQWIDPTVANAPFGFLPWFDSGAGALLMREGGAELVTLPKVDDPGATRYEVTVRPRADNKSDLEVMAEYRGEDAVDMRRELIPVSESERASFLQRWAGEARPGSVLQSHELLDLDQPDKPLRLKARLEAPGLLTRSDALMTVRGCVLDCYETNPISRSERKHPFYVDRGRRTEQIVTILPSEGMKAATLPASQTARSVIGSLTLACGAADNGGVRCTRTLTLPRERWPEDQGGSVRAMFDKILVIDRTSIAFDAGTAGSD